MILRIVWKEILSNIKSLRFLLGTVLFLSLVVIFTFVLTGDYRSKQENYNQFVSINEKELKQLMTYQNLKPTVYKPPEILAVFSKGVVENVGNSARISIGEVPFPESAATSKNPLISVFPILDITLIFKIVISIFTLLLAYDSISGEKEDRTLALMLSNGIPRYRLLLGKFLGGMITIAIPIAIGFLVLGILLSVSPMVNLVASDLVRIVFIFLISLLIVAVLFCLGLLISSLTRTASESLVLLLFIWVLYVIVIPSSSTYLASQIKPVVSREEIDIKVEEIWEEFEREIEDFETRSFPIRQQAMEKLRELQANNPSAVMGYFEEMMKKYPELSEMQSDAQEPWGWYHEFATKGLVRRKQKLNAFVEPLRAEYADKVWHVENDYLDMLKKQKNISDIFFRFSPISVFEMLISGLSRSDVASSENFYEQAREYRNQLINYLANKNAFSAIRYFATVKEDFLFNVENIEDYGVLREKYVEDKAVPLASEDIPRFQFQSEEVVTTIQRFLSDMTLLCIMGILFFLCASVALLKYDVR